jgi:hypothetical protein
VVGRFVVWMPTLSAEAHLAVMGRHDVPPKWGAAASHSREFPLGTGLALRGPDGQATFKRDYVSGAELRDAESVLAQLGDWFAGYNTQAPHAALGLRSPVEYRATLDLTPSV